jgi:SAM-dependent methyltransferase
MSVAGDRWASGAAYEGFIGRWSRLVAPEFVDWLAQPAGLRWLDVGCGTGILTRTILDRSAPASVVGVDPAQPFVDHARQAVADARVAFRVGSADATGCEAASVDALVAGLVLNFVPDLDAALAEAQRVVRPTGIVAGYVWDYAAGMQLLRRFFDAAIALDPEMRAHDEGVRFPITHEGRLAGAFEAAGLLEVDQRPIDVSTVFRDFDDLWTPFLRGTGPAPAYVVSLDEPARAALRDRLRASLSEEADGSIHLTARAWAVRGYLPEGP